MAEWLSSFTAHLFASLVSEAGQTGDRHGCFLIGKICVVKDARNGFPILPPRRFASLREAGQRGGLSRKTRRLAKYRRC